MKPFHQVYDSNCERTTLIAKLRHGRSVPLFETVVGEKSACESKSSFCLCSCCLISRLKVIVWINERNCSLANAVT